MYTQEQIEANRKTFLEALRSGKYPQSTQRLRREDGFCCLGVACDVSELGTWAIYRPEFQLGVAVLEYLGENSVLPVSVQDWLGMDDSNPRIARVNFIFRAASELNDNLEWDFDQIADAFEHYFKTGELYYIETGEQDNV